MTSHEHANAVRSPLVPQFKAALRITIDAAGGVEAVSTLLGLNKGRISDMTNLALEAGPSPWRLAEIERFAGVAHVTRALAAVHGCILAPVPSSAPVPLTARSVGELAKEAGEAIAAVAVLVEAIRHDVHDRDKACREIDEAMAVLAGLRQTLRG